MQVRTGISQYKWLTEGPEGLLVWSEFWFKD